MPWVVATLSFLFVVVSFEEIRKALLLYPLPTPNSDVLLQLETMYDRLVHHQFPYAPVPSGTYSPYPVYMPMHFLPIALAKACHMDIRWCGFWMYALAAFLFGFQLGKAQLTNGIRIFLACLPSIVLWVYILFGGMDIFITMEVLIAAYYMILAIGLLFRNNALLITGIILCLLSRYTFIFWLPLLFLLLWKENQRLTLKMAGIIFTAILCLYIIPFFSRDTSILNKGISYHNLCAVEEWKWGFWTSESGIHFAWMIKQLCGDNLEQGVLVNRVIQALALLLTLAISLAIYFVKKRKPNSHLFALAFLNIFMLVFFCFCPLTYRYYLISLLVLNAMTLCGFFLPGRFEYRRNSIFENKNMTITYYGHSFFGIQFQDKHLLFDPFISDLPLAKSIDVDEIPADYIFLSHGHADHIQDAERIALRTGAKVVCTAEIHEWLNNKGVSNTHPMNTGGSWKFENFTVKCVVAQHSSGLPDGSYGGNPMGFLILSDSVNFYFAGDTALTMDMQLIPLWCKLDVAFLPIGSNFTMDIDDAIRAASFIQCNHIIGMHFDTFGYIQIDHEEAHRKFIAANCHLKLPAITETFEL